MLTMSFTVPVKALLNRVSRAPKNEKYGNTLCDEAHTRQALCASMLSY